jgi:hypothetical protein
VSKKIILVLPRDRWLAIGDIRSGGSLTDMIDAQEDRGVDGRLVWVDKLGM